MSRYAYKPRNTEREFTAHDAHIVSIEYVDNKVIRALVKHIHGGHAGASVKNEMLSIEEAKRVWRSDPRRFDQKKDADVSGPDLGGVFEDEMPDVEAYISEVMLQESRSFNSDKHDWYQRHKRALSVKATCVVSYNGDKNFARVSGAWCTLSRHIKLQINGYTKNMMRDPITGQQVAVVDAVGSKNNYGIQPMRMDTITGRQFYELMREGDTLHENVCNHHTRAFFKTSSAGCEPRQLNASQNAPPRAALPSYMTPVVYRNRTQMEQSDAIRSVLSSAQVAQESAVQRMGRLQQDKNSEFGAACNRVVRISELLERIKEANIGLNSILKTEFCALGLRLVLLNEPIQLMLECYQSREVMLDSVARGSEFVAIIHDLMQRQPHILCFKRLRVKYGEQMERRDLAMLPDIALNVYTNLCKKFNVPVPDRCIQVAVDIYIRILKRDVYGSNNNHAPGDNEPTIGHMFSVFGAHEGHRQASYYHGRRSMERSVEPDPIETLRDVNTMTYSGRFVLPTAEEWDAMRQANVIPLATRQMLQPDVSRLELRASTEEFIGALVWMRAVEIIEVRTYAGTGPYNRGQQFDAVYLYEIYDTQLRTIEALTDIHKRAIDQSIHHDPRPCALPELVALQKKYTEHLDEWRSGYKMAVNVTEAQRKMLKALDCTANTDQPQPPVSAKSPIATLANTIARQYERLEKRYATICEKLPYDHVSDAYCDARRQQPLYHWPLTRHAKPPYQLDDGTPFHAEQIEALQNLAVNGVSVLTGRGGVGKSELIGHLIKQYSSDQVMCVSFTGQVASELSRRSGHTASTIHSVLYRHTQYMEAYHKAQSYRKHRLKNPATAPRKAGEDFVRDDVVACKDDRELRAYVEHMIGGYPPLLSPFERVRVLIIDETSLMAFTLFAQLLRAAHCPAQGRFLERLIMVGDLDQLPSIGYGNVQSDIAHGMPSAVQQLVVNHRSDGTELFPLAQALAEHRHQLPIPEFDDIDALAQLRERVPARQRDIICLQTTASGVAEAIELVYEELGAVKNHALRRKIQCLAPTNKEVLTANDAIRWLYFGQNLTQAARASQAAVQMIRHNAGTSDEERESINDLLRNQIVVGDRIYLTRNETQRFPGREPDEPTREVRFFSSRLLECIQFYDAPARLTPSIKCRCGLCTEEQRTAPERTPCIERRDLVPPLRQQVLDPGKTDPHNYFKFHSDRLYPLSSDTKRMAVFRDTANRYIEVDVARQLVPRTKYDHAFAMTVHKMQGSQADIVVYVCTRPSSFVNWKHLYTAATRARKRLIILSSSTTFSTVARKREPHRRSAMWYQIGCAFASALRNKPDSLAAQYASRVCPTILDEEVWRNTEAAWNLFELRRYRTDTAPEAPRPMFVPRIEQAPLEQTPPEISSDPVTDLEESCVDENDWLNSITPMPMLSSSVAQTNRTKKRKGPAKAHNVKRRKTIVEK